MSDFFAELTWRGLVHDATPGVKEFLGSQKVTGYIGFDPTADSLGVGNLVQIMTLAHFQRAGHKPIALLGGATAMVGDPSGKSAERPLMSEDTIAHNLAGQKAQLARFLDFGTGAGQAEFVNNHDWYKAMPVLSFLREVGKFATVNGMLARDSVKRRLEGDDGMSFTEFSYALVQAFDFYWLWKHRGVRLQMGGSDQWGNIVAGTELIRRKEGGTAYGVTTPLVTRADGTKFGKSEAGNVWLDAARTSPYAFYQFWLNATDADAVAYLKIFTAKSQAEVEALAQDLAAAPQGRAAQRALAREVTFLVHGETGLRRATAAADILFGAGTREQLAALGEAEFEEVFVGAGVKVARVPRDKLGAGVPLPELFCDFAGLIPSRSQAHALLKANALAINKVRVADARTPIGLSSLIAGRYLLLQKGKKDYCLLCAV